VQRAAKWIEAEYGRLDILVNNAGTASVALVTNLAIVAYLLFAERLFGLRGGGKAERAEQERATGWAPVERATPPAR
jgi:NAD(P)-dependent dehydrogenase (short-subunit alcohol dehydrogenase family)